MSTTMIMIFSFFLFRCNNLSEMPMEFRLKIISNFYVSLLLLSHWILYNVTKRMRFRHQQYIVATTNNKQRDAIYMFETHRYWNIQQIYGFIFDIPFYSNRVFCSKKVLFFFSPIFFEPRVWTIQFNHIIN